MRKIGRLSIRAKLHLLAIVSAGTALVLACAGFLINDKIALSNQAVQHLVAVADVLAANVVAPLTFDQPEPAQEVLASLRYQPMVQFAGVYNNDRESFAVFRREGASQAPLPAPTLEKKGQRFTDDGRLDVVAEIRDSEERLGTLFIRARMDHVQEQFRKHLLIAVGVLLAALAVSFVVAAAMQRKISGPILDLAETAATISDNRDYSVRVNRSTHDELGVLYDAFNGMLDRIQEGEAQLRQAHEQLEDRVARRTRQLSETNTRLASEVAERERAEKELRAVQAQHVEAARRAGMAEIATSVLHNVGNALNSVNISANLVAERVRSAGLADFVRAADLIQRHLDDFGAYVTQDERGRHLPAFLIKLAAKMASDEEAIASEAQALIKSVGHIKDIVALQQSYAGVAGLVEVVSLAELLDDAIRINESSILRHGVEIVREYEALPPTPMEKQKFIQIIVNLISNAKYAVLHRGDAGGRITIRLARSAPDRVRIDVADNGIGIAAENLTKIFTHGFTTKRGGHGFGLHGSALHAKEMRGSLSVASPGPGRGATFTLELPFAAETEDQSMQQPALPLADAANAPGTNAFIDAYR